MCQYVIELTGLTKKYGDFTAVNDLNLQIRKGEIFAAGAERGREIDDHTDDAGPDRTDNWFRKGM